MQLEEQERVLNNTSKNMLVSASAGSGKTYIMIKYICKLVCEEKIPLDNFLVLTFTKAAAAQMCCTRIGEGLICYGKHLHNSLFLRKISKKIRKFVEFE